MIDVEKFVSRRQEIRMKFTPFDLEHTQSVWEQKVDFNQVPPKTEVDPHAGHDH